MVWCPELQFQLINIAIVDDIIITIIIIISSSLVELWY